MVKKLLKIFLTSTFFVVAIIAIMLYIFPKYIDQKVVKSRVDSVLTESFGQPVSAEKIAFTLIPHVSVSIGSVRVGEGNQAIKVNDLKMFVDIVDLLLYQDLNGTYNASYHDTVLNGKLHYTDVFHMNSDALSSVKLIINSPFSVNISGKIASKPSKLVLENVKVQFPKTQGMVNLKVTDLLNTPVIRGKIEFDVFDIAEITDLLTKVKVLKDDVVADIKKQEALSVTEVALDEVTTATKDEGATKSTEETSPIIWSTIPYDSKWLQYILDVEFFIKQLKHKRYDAGVISAHVEGEMNALRTSIKSSKFFGGNLDVNSAFRFENETFLLDKTLKFNQIAIGQLAKAFLGIQRLEGDGDLEITFSSHGKNEDEIIKNVKGTALVKMLNGAFLGVDVAELADTSEQNIRKVLEAEGNDTEILALTGNATIEKGILSLEELLVEMPFAQKLYAEGDVDIHSQTLNMKITPALKAIVGLKLPLRVTGNLYDPSVFVDPLSAVIDNVDQLEILQTKPVKKVLDGVKAIGGGILSGIGRVGINAVKGTAEVLGGENEKSENAASNGEAKKENRAKDVEKENIVEQSGSKAQPVVTENAKEAVENEENSRKDDLAEEVQATIKTKELSTEGVEPKANADSGVVSEGVANIVSDEVVPLVEKNDSSPLVAPNQPAIEVK